MPHASDWSDAIIQSHHDVTPTVREFTLQPLDGAQTFEPGSHLQVQVLIGVVSENGI